MTKIHILLREKKSVFVVKSIQKPNFLLDCGCGNGSYTNEIKPKIGRVVGIDINKTALQEYKTKIGKEKSEVILASLDFLPLRKGLFDTALFLDSLEHGRDPKNTLLQVYNNLRIDGMIIITVPNWYNKFLDAGKTGHQHFHSSIGWKKLVTEAGFKPTQITCLSFPVFDLAIFRNYLHFLGFWVAITGKKNP